MNTSLICIICKDKKGLKRMNDTFLKQGKILTYIDAFLCCFNLQFLEKNLKGHNRICKKCVAKLKYCCVFRKDVETAHRRLYNALETNGKVKTYKNSKSLLEINKVSSSLNNGYVSEFDNFLEDSDHKEGTDIADDGYKDSKCDEEQILDENSNDSNWSVKTEEILRATGYWRELETVKSKPQIVTPILDKNTRTCPQCSETFSLHQNLVLHFTQHYATHLCEICGKTYASRTSMKNHMLAHDGVTYKCEECIKSFPTIRHLKAHMKGTHRGVKKFICYKCKERFTNRHARRTHLVMVHNLEKEKNHCPLCDCALVMMSDLRKHLKETHFDTWHIKCVECSLVFLKVNELKRHLVLHSGARDYKCEFCGKEFAWRSNLREHVKIHLNIKEYVCNECDKAFVQRAAMLGHIKTHNKQQSTSYTDK